MHVCVCVCVCVCVHTLLRTERVCSDALADETIIFLAKTPGNREREDRGFPYAFPDNGQFKNELLKKKG